MRLYYVQTVQTYCTTNSMSRHRLLLKILQVTRTQTTAVSLLQLMVIGDSHCARMNTVLSVSQVSDRLKHNNIGFVPRSPVFLLSNASIGCLYV